jgi:hypothetical protein
MPIFREKIMKTALLSGTFFFLFAIFSCNSWKSITISKSSDKCSLTKAEALVIADSILEVGNNDQIWNLYEVDTVDYFSMEGHFTSPKTTSRIVFLGGKAGGSSGSSNNLLLLLSCSSRQKVIWAGQVGPISQENIQDLTNDGVLEISYSTGSTWMGECADQYRIFNFYNQQLKEVYSHQSFSRVSCGRESYASMLVGDTLAVQYNTSFIKKNSETHLQQIKTTSIYTGGESEEEVIKKMSVTCDTILLQLH